MAALVLLLSSCEGESADDRLAYVSGNRRVEVALGDFGSGDLIVREDTLFVRATEVIRAGSPQGLITAVGMAETRAAGLAAEWLSRRSNPAGGDAPSTSITLIGGSTLLQQVKDGRVHVFRAYPVPR